MTKGVEDPPYLAKRAVIFRSHEAVKAGVVNGEAVPKGKPSRIWRNESGVEVVAVKIGVPDRFSFDDLGDEGIVLF